jgi:hypothetical protein
VVGVATGTGTPWNWPTDIVVSVYIMDPLTLTLMWRGPTGKRVPTLMSVDRRDSAALINISTLLPAGPLRIGAERKCGGWKSGIEEASRE